MKHIFKHIAACVLLSLIIFGCKKEDAYKDFVKGGAIIYPGKPLGLKALAGKNRAKLSWVVIDAKVSRFVIHWNNRMDSLEVPAVNTGETADTVNVIVGNLPENNYIFEIVSYDSNGNKSIKEEVATKVYGDEFIGSLLNRPIKRSGSMSGVAEVYWGTPEQSDVGVEVKYTDNSGMVRNVTVSNTDTLTTLANYKNGTQFSYRTFFLPDTMSFDTVSTAFVSPPAPVVTYRQLSSSTFKPYVLPTDATTAWGWTLPMLWDNNTAEGSGFHTFDVAMPAHFSIDLGVVTSLHEIKVWQRVLTLYDAGNLRNFEIWGSTAPAADGSFTGWTKLGTFESIKPSGQASGYTTADGNYAKAGESFIFPDNIPEVRYLRFKVFKNWLGKNPGAIHLMEMKLWTK
ncbi:MAG: hypothetical protein EOO88_12020 [Pedobacter sp.]|nr:MAG: hypothetical protein EOO88_12020 [Pedobacter sp.]